MCSSLVTDISGAQLQGRGFVDIERVAMVIKASVMLYQLSAGLQPATERRGDGSSFGSGFSLFWLGLFIFLVDLDVLADHGASILDHILTHWEGRGVINLTKNFQQVRITHIRLIHFGQETVRFKLFMLFLVATLLFCSACHQIFNGLQYE